MADFPADLPAVFLEAAVRPAGPRVDLAADVPVARFFVVDLPPGALAVDLRPVAPLAAAVPCRRAADDARLATADLLAVDLPAVDLLGFFLALEGAPLRAVEPVAVFLPVTALAAPTVVFFVAALAVAALVAPLAGDLVPTDFLAAAFFAGVFSDLVAPCLFVDLRGLVVAMRILLRMGADLPRRPAFDNTAAMQVK